MKGKLIVIEGANNSGKTSVAMEIYSQLVKDGVDVDLYRQPYFPDVREKLLQGGLSPAQEYQLFLEDRTKLLNHINMLDSEIIILDRSWISSLCYQSLQTGDNLLKSIIKNTTLDLYNSLDLKIDLLAYVHAEPKVIAERYSDDGEYDYRDSNNTNQIERELINYLVACDIAIDLGLVNKFERYINNNFDDFDENVNSIINEIYEMLDE